MTDKKPLIEQAQEQQKQLDAMPKRDLFKRKKRTSRNPYKPGQGTIRRNRVANDSDVR